MIITDLFCVRNNLSNGKNIYDIPLRVTFYARVSTDREEQMNSLQNQIMYFEDFISKQTNWTFVPGYVDEGISGTSVKKRSSFLEMIDNAKEGRFDLILTKEISRFSRNTIDSIKYTQELLSFGVGVYYMSDNINTFEADSELRLTIMSSIAQEEVRKLSERVRFGYKRSIEKGIVGGSSNIYGYRKKSGRLLIDDEQALIVKRIFELYVNDNIGCAKIGQFLYSLGIKNSVGRCIHASTIKAIIKNPKYKGYFCANKYGTIDYRSKKRRKIDENDWVVYKDPINVPPIVSEDIWNRANEILRKRSKKYSNSNEIIYSRRYPLTGKIICMKDNVSFIRGNYKLKSGKRFFWACSNYRKNGKKNINGCENPIIYETKLVEIFKNKLEHLITEKKSIVSQIVDLINSSFQINDYEKTKYRNKKELNFLNNDKENLIKMRLNNEIDLGEYLSYKNRIDRQIKTIKDSLVEIEKKCSNKNRQKITVDLLMQDIYNSIFNDSNSILEITSVLYSKIYVHTNFDNLKKVHISVEYYDLVQHFWL